MMQQLKSLVIGACVLLLLVCCVHETVGRPSEVASHEDLLSPLTGKSETILLNEDSASDSDKKFVAWGAPHSQVRERRSPQFQPRQPAPQQPQQARGPRGDVSVDVHRERGVGTVVSAQGSGNVWTSRDGSARVDAHGHYDRVVRGPMRSRSSYGGGVTFRKRF